MGCRDCGNKTSRHNQPGRDIDRQESPFEKPQVRPGKGFTPEGAGDPIASFLAAKELSYAQMKEQANFRLRLADSQEREIISAMTEDMKRFHVEELISTYNCEKMHIPNMSPERALTMLKNLMDMEDFSFISGIYPDLKEQVNSKYQEIISKRINISTL
jgi:hypothetical protein